MKYEEIDLNDFRNPHVSEINGVLMDTRFLRANVKGTKHFKRRIHLKAVAEKQKKPKFVYY
jgi:hypothetical protein